MTKKLGQLGESICFCAALLFSVLMTIRTVMTGLDGGAYALVMLAGCLGMGAVLWLFWRFAKESRLYPLFLFLLRLLLAATFLLLVKTQPMQDFQTMYEAACQLANGSREYLNDVYFYNWAYQTGFVAYEALVIRVFGAGLLPLKLLNALWMAGTGVLVYAIGRCFLSERAAMTASFFYALYPAPYFLASVLTNQHIATFFYYLALWLLLRQKKLTWKNAVLAGLALAIGNVMRPIGAVVVLAVLCWGAVRFLTQGKPYLQEAAAVLVCTAVYFAAGWLFSHLVVWTGMNPEGLTNNLPLWKFLLGLNPAGGGIWNKADYNTFYTLPAAQAEPAMRQAIAERLHSGVSAFLQLFWEKIRVLWGSCEDLQWACSHLDLSARVCGVSVQTWLKAVKFADRGVFLLASLLSLPGLWLAVRKKAQNRHVLLLPAFVLCGYVAVHLFIEVQSRYRYFLMPCVFLLAGVGVEKLFTIKNTDSEISA